MEAAEKKRRIDSKIIELHGPPERLTAMEIAIQLRVSPDYVSALISARGDTPRSKRTAPPGPIKGERERLKKILGEHRMGDNCVRDAEKILGPRLRIRPDGGWVLDGNICNLDAVMRAANMQLKEWGAEQRGNKPEWRV